MNVREALIKYGTHTSDCRYRGGHDCTCGLEELRNAGDSAGVKLDSLDLTVESMVRHPGGQHVGTEAGVRIIHASGLVAEARTDRSQLRNRQIASDMLLGGLTSPHFRG